MVEWTHEIVISGHERIVLVQLRWYPKNSTKYFDIMKGQIHRIRIQAVVKFESNPDPDLDLITLHYLNLQTNF